MSGSWNVLGGKKTPDRRSSSSGQVSNSSMLAGGGGGARIDQRRPLMSMLSEDGGSSRYSTQETTQTNSGVEQSFLSKLTNKSDSKPVSINTINEKQPQLQQQRKVTIINQDRATCPLREADVDNNSGISSTATLNHGTECDRDDISSNKPKNDLENKDRNSKNIRSSSSSSSSNSSKLLKGNDYIKSNVEKEDGGDKDLELKDGNDDEKTKSESEKNNEKTNECKDDDVGEEDDDNQVIPSWPSKSDASRSINSEFIQHKVYSLKDYSQVASPTATPITNNQVIGKPQSLIASESKLLKSMSQDRKVKTNTKRLSECLYLSSAASPLVTGASGCANDQSLPAGGEASSSNKSQQNPSSSGRHQLASTMSNQSAAARASKDGTNIGLLPNPSHAVLMNESRIDRMRKLFVSPLSLKSSTSSGLGGHGKSNSAALRGAGSHQRLSFQSGASSMLNKPQHLMHAMYRTGGAYGGHGGSGSRRSPMRQEQASKSFLKVYGCPLQMANNIYPITCFGRADIYKQKSVPYVLARLCNYIEENSSHLTHEGIFRVSGNARLMVKLRTLFDHLGDAPLESESVDVATSASMLKMYLRELPEPLIPTRMNYYFITLAKKYSLFLAKDNSQSISGYRQPHATSTSVTPSTTTTTTTTTETTGSSGGGDSGNQSAKERQRMAFSRDLTKLVRKLPIENYNLLKYLACFLYRISLKQQYNKMCAEALGIVFGPNIFRIRNESYKGLKEQELSNQIMASIISNYKSIFDSEITDPLGNLVKPNETAADDGELGDDKILVRVVAAAAVSAATSPIVATGPATSQSKVPMGGSRQHDVQESSPPIGQANSAPRNIHTTPRASTSKGHCCPVHCLAHESEMGASADQGGSHIAADSELRVCELLGHEDDDDDDDDVCDDEGESYTPSSNSDSYCSSIGSETIETSSCVDDNEDDDNDDEYGRGFGSHISGARDNFELATPRSSSECASDTSYTPTSSHTDSDGLPDDGADEADESLYENSSSFDSSLSLGDNDGLEKKPQREPQMCRVCERRVSAHLDRMANGDVISKVCDTSKTIEEDEPTTDGQVASNNPEQLPMGGTRKRQVDGDHIKEVPEDIDRAETTTGATQEAPEDQAADGSQKPVSSRRPTTLATGNNKRPPRSTTASRLDFSRRRSSSASSLGRIRQAQTAISTPPRSQHRGLQRVELRQHQPTRSNRLISERTPRGRSSSSRRIKGRGHSIRRLGGAVGVVVDENCARASGSSRDRGAVHARGGLVAGGWATRCSRRKSNRRQQHVMQSVTRSKHHSSSNEMNFDDWRHSLTGGHNWLPETPLGAERYFLLRSFNSDETLLKSFSFNARPETDVCRSRRRFSGIDAHSNSTMGLQSSRLCEQIFEEESRSSRPSDGHVQPDEIDQIIHHLPNIPQQPIEQSFGASFVSLLDHRLVGFRKSDVSIDEGPSNRKSNHKDCIWVQMQAVNELVRSMKRLKRLGSSCGYSASMERLVRGLPISGLRGYSDDCSACEVDYLSALSLVGQIETSLNSPVATVETTLDATLATVKEIDSILSEKISLLKQRQTDLKAIRDHYWKIHAGRRFHEHKVKTQSSRPKETIRSKSESGIHNSLVATVAGGAKTTTLSSRPRKLSAPINELEFSCSSSTSSLVDDSNRTHNWPTTVCNGVESSSRFQKSAANCKFGPLCPLEFVFNIEKQLASKRNQGARVVKLNEMTMDQLISEKLELQKNLLRYEHWFGRPTSRLDFSLVGHIYERYRAVKMIKLYREDQHGD